MTRVHNILHNTIRLYGVNVKLQTTDGGGLMNRIRMGCQTQKRTISHNVRHRRSYERFKTRINL